MDATGRNHDAIGRVIGKDVYDESGDKIGSAAEVYLDDETGQPEWVTVRTGLFDTKESFVPIRDADLTHDGLRVPISKSKVKEAPKIDTDGHLSPQEEQELRRYYGLGVGTDMHTTTSANAMTPSEVRPNLGISSKEVGPARLRKYVVTENVRTTPQQLGEGVQPTVGDGLDQEERSRAPQVKKPSTPLGKVKVSFNLWPEDVERLRHLAGDARTTVTAALQRAIADESFLMEELGKGAALLLKYPDGQYRQVIIRR